jgi:hypothetical protein
MLPRLTSERCAGSGWHEEVPWGCFCLLRSTYVEQRLQLQPDLEVGPLCPKVPLDILFHCECPIIDFRSGLGFKIGSIFFAFQKMRKLRKLGSQVDTKILTTKSMNNEYSNIV